MDHATNYDSIMNSFLLLAIIIIVGLLEEGGDVLSSIMHLQLMISFKFIRDSQAG